MASREWASVRASGSLAATSRISGLLTDAYQQAHSKELGEFTVVRTIVDITVIQPDLTSSANILNAHFAIYPWPEVALATEPTIESETLEAHYTDYLLMSVLHLVPIISSGSSLDGRFFPASAQRHYDLRAARKLGQQEALVWALRNDSALSLDYLITGRLLLVIK